MYRITCIKTLDYVEENYPFTTTLNIDDFADIFAEVLGPRIDQVFMLLGNGTLECNVDLYESLSSIVTK